MDQDPRTDTPIEQPDANVPVIEATSTEYLGQWNRLVSTTNWEKGRIICEWRQKLTDAEVPPSSYTDEAWSRWVGNVSPQHAGRLRRVYQRFGATREQYAGLYWSHFQAALDFNDAEMWLEGAVQNGWSISQMRHQRWEAIGAPAEKKPREEDIISGELDEDVDPKADGEVAETISDSTGVVQDDTPSPDGVPLDDPTAGQAEADGGEDMPSPEDQAAEDQAAEDQAAEDEAAEPVRPFENLAAMPADLGEAFESFKLAILHHRLSGWQEVSCEDVLAALSALKQLAAAPAEN